MDTDKLFSAITGGLDAIAPMLPGIGAPILLGISGAVGLVGDLIKLGMNPRVEIDEIRSSIEPFQAAKARLQQKLREKFPNE